MICHHFNNFTTVSKAKPKKMHFLASIYFLACAVPALSCWSCATKLHWTLQAWTHGSHCPPLVERLTLSDYVQINWHSSSSKLKPVPVTLWSKAFWVFLYVWAHMDHIFFMHDQLDWEPTGSQTWLFENFKLRFEGKIFCHNEILILIFKRGNLLVFLPWLKKDKSFCPTWEWVSKSNLAFGRKPIGLI